MIAPTLRQRALTQHGDHRLTLCLDSSHVFELPSGSYRFLCESKMGHDPPCGAALENSSLRWNEEPSDDD